MKFLFSSGIVVYFKKKTKIEYLLLHYESGHWGFTKGKIEKGENKVQAAIRELKEETCLNVILHKNFEKSFTYIFTDKSGKLVKKRAYFFIGESITKKVTLSFEHIGFDWLEFESAHEKLTYDNTRQLLKSVDEFLKN